MKRVLAAVLALVMILGSVPLAAFASETSADTSSTGSALNGPLSLPDASAASSGFASGGDTPDDSTESTTASEDLTKFEPASTPFSQEEAASGYEAGDQVTFIVVVDEQPLLATYSVEDIADQTAAVVSSEARQTQTLDAVKALAEDALDECEMGFDYTISTTGFSVTTDYANKAELEALPGVKSVYVAPTFYLPEDGKETDYTPYTNNATTMIGADVLNTSGYTGKGMRIAILDTGILVDHPSFAALPDSALEDPMTRQSVDDIWDTLNASHLTNRLNQSYKNSKIPFAFNYSNGEFDVSNTYAGSDHGTHVAGIAAANKIADSRVVGVAPDAQLVVMQVFSSGGGAGWATILAALEDCVRLKVDSVNLSLGSAAGFTDTPDMIEVMKQFQDSDIQVLIAAGNDTNNAQGNHYGLNKSLLANPDTGLVGTPATYSAALSVASVDNDGYTQLYITVDGQEFGYLDTAAKAATNFQENFRNKELEYVMVPGYGADSDYEGIDVTGKVAVISRGSSSFPEKQSIAQAHGAIAAIIYNNELGVIRMQINDGEGNIPAISVTQACGEALKNGSGKLTVCNGDTKLFRLDRTVSSFSSWGVTPDLKLKPEISGVGGSIYSATDPAISGGYYDYMSGTSMATPQITGAMAVLIEYLDKNYPDLTGAEQRKVAADLLMSTADPLMATSTLEYSPRAQGAGLANLVSATTSPAYLSNKDASEGRPKIEFGDDDDKTGVYTFTFEINNLKDKDLTYTLSSNLITEAIYQDKYINASPYALEAKVSFTGGDTVTVPASGSVTVTGTITLTDADKAYLNKFPNGMFVEGFIYATPAADGEGSSPVTLSLPLVGFYGDWSAADVFDTEDEENYSLYPVRAFTNAAQLGTNPYIRTGKSGDKYNAFSYDNPLAEIDFGMLRNARKIVITVTDTANGTKYFDETWNYAAKSYYSASYGQVIPAYLEQKDLWDGNDKDGNALPDGTKVTFRMDAYLDDGDDTVDDSIVFDMTLDTEKPRILNADDIQASLSTENGRNYLTLKLQDNAYMAAVLFESTSGAIMGKFDVENEPGVAFEQKFDITGFGNEFTIVAADYACNETVLDVIVKLDDNDKPEAVNLSKDRIYGNETSSNSAVEGGWFSGDKETFSDLRNETFDSNNRYYAAEYINGYLIAQSASTGSLELVTPSGTYWKTQTLVTQSTKAGEAGSWVLYDMALDYSGKYAEALDPYESTNGTDTLFALGWAYKGDNDKDGHDDGYNCLYRIWTSKWNGQWFVDEIGKITGGKDGAELLTLGITTEGEMYTIGTDGALYSLSLNDDARGATAIYIGETDFVNVENYSGTNVIQSMGYDHNTDTMYWFALSQGDKVFADMTYKVDLTTAKCTAIGGYGTSGRTSLFVPTDMTSDMFVMGVEPNQFNLDSYKVTMVAGQNRRLSVDWTPWNCKPTEIIWKSSDDTVATVDGNGIVTAVKEGTATISATAQVYDSWEKTWSDRTVECIVTVVKSETGMYGFIVEDFANIGNRFTWVTYADRNPGSITKLGSHVTVDVPDTDGNLTATDALWQGGAYYNGYLYTVMAQGRGGVGASVLYRSKVTKGETPDKTVIGAPEEIGYTTGIELGNMAFDYNTGRMYACDMTNGGLAILDIETGAIDPLGTFSGDIGGPALATAMTVTADGTILIASMDGKLYTVNPDTLSTTQVGSINSDTWYYAGMMYDYNTGNIYWNPCMSAGSSSLYLVTMGTNEWSDAPEASIMKLGNVSSRSGVEQTVMFAIPDNEPETTYIPVESLTITNGSKVTGIMGGELQLTTSTTPARPSSQVKAWTSSDEKVVTVDQFGKLTYIGVGTATVTATISKNTVDGKPITASVEVTVLESAGKIDAFLNNDEGGTGYYDFWISMNDYDLRHASAGNSMISVLSLQSGTYYDGFFYAFNDKGEVLRIDPKDTTAYTVLGASGLDVSYDQVTAMAMDYTTGTMYALTLPCTWDYSVDAAVSRPGSLATVDLDTGKVTKIAELDMTNKVFAMAIDKNGTMYVAGSADYYTDAVLYTMDKTTGALTKVKDLTGMSIYTGNTYYGDMRYNTQMTYDFGTDRLYLNATSSTKSASKAFGMYLIQLGGETPEVYSLGGISLYTRAGSSMKFGDVYLGLMALIPEDEEVPSTAPNGVVLSKDAYRIRVGGTAQIDARVRPANATDPSLTYAAADAAIATVSSTGLITGVKEGETTITITTGNGLKATVKVTVVDATGPSSTAYTVTPKGDKLLSFNPNLPSETTAVIGDFASSGKVVGMAYGDNCLYYALDSGAYPGIYRYDFVTGQSTYLGLAQTWTTVADIAYDKQNDLLYAVGGFYLFQFDLSKANGESMPYSAYMMDTEYITHSGVAVVDGAVYVVGTDLYNSTPLLVKYSDKYLSDRTVVKRGVNVNIKAGVTEMDYDASGKKFYLTDGLNRVYAMDMEGNTGLVDTMDQEIRGLAIDPTLSYTVIYTDGVEDEEVFPDQRFAAEAGKATPDFRGTPARKGYTFTGWTPEVAETVTAHATYTATWKVNSYLIHLDARGGKVSPENVTVTYGQPVGELPAATREGYDFVGWFDLDGNEYTADTVYTVDDNITLSAKWTAKDYTVTLDPNGGTVDISSRTITITYGTEVGPLPTPEREGYGFIGWFDENGDKVLPFTEYRIPHDSTFTAHWAEKTFTITLDANGGTVDPDTVAVAQGAAVSTLPVPVREGYTFAGWFDAEGNEYTAETIFEAAADITLSAKWTANTYTLTLDADGGIVEPDTLNVTFGTAIGKLPVAIKDGYTFAGWYTADGKQVTAETVYETAADSTVTAKWVPLAYTVTLDDGCGNTTTITVNYGEKIGTLPTPKRDGYTFGGWFDAKGNAVTADTIVTGSLALSAKWTAVTVTPATGDSFDPMFWTGMMLLALGAAAYVALASKKSKKH